MVTPYFQEKTRESKNEGKKNKPLIVLSSRFLLPLLPPFFFSYSYSVSSSPPFQLPLSRSLTRKVFRPPSSGRGRGDPRDHEDVGVIATEYTIDHGDGTSTTTSDWIKDQAAIKEPFDARETVHHPRRTLPIPTAALAASSSSSSSAARVAGGPTGQSQQTQPSVASKRETDVRRRTPPPPQLQAHNVDR
jgi:hypothetical protein